MGRHAFLLLLAAAFGVGGYQAYLRLVAKPDPITARQLITVPLEKQSADRKIVSEVPDVALVDRDGVRRSVRDFPASLVIYNFWASWCEPCRREIPLLNRLRKQHHADGIEVIGIAVDRRDAILEYLKTTAVDYPLLIGEQDGLTALDAFGVPSAFPISVFADRRRRIVAVKLGELHEDEATYIVGVIGDLNASRIDLAEAKQRVARQWQEFARQRAQADQPAPNSEELSTDL